MPYPNFHAMRVRDPDDFARIVVMKTLDNGVMIYGGPLKSDPNGPMHTQAYRFPKDKFTASEAKKWCEEYDVHGRFEEASGESKYTIPVHGLIGSPEKANDTAKYFQYDEFLLHVNKAKEADIIELDVASDGGYVDVADKMIEVLKSTKKQIVSRNSGNVCSAASKLFTLAPKSSRFFDPSKGVFLIHNPFGTIEGSSDELAQASKELEAVEQSYAKWYAEATGSDESVIRAFMEENKPLTSDQVESLGFATIITPTVNAFAKLKSINTMAENKELKEKMTLFEKFIDTIVAKFRPKAIMIADVNGNELEFPDLNDASELAVGAKVNLKGSPAEGEYKLPDGRTIVCAAGQVKEIKEAQQDELETLKNENKALKDEIEKLKAEKTASDDKAEKALEGLNEVKAKFKEFKAQFSEGDPAGGLPPGDDGTKNRKPFKTKDNVSNN